MSVSVRRGFPALALIVLFAPPAAAQNWPVPYGPPRTPAEYRYDPAAWKAVPPDYLDDAPACILYSHSEYRLEADGTVETTCHELTRLNGRKGIEQVGEYKSITYTPSYEKLALHDARIHKADGTVTKVEPRHVQLRDVNTDHLVYDPSKQLVISFPGLEVGDVIEVRWSTRGKHPEYAGHLFTRYTFGADKSPTAPAELVVR